MGRPFGTVSPQEVSQMVDLVRRRSALEEQIEATDNLDCR